MNFSVDKNKLNMASEQIMRQAGYAFIRDRMTGKESFVYRLSNLHYPRLHMYIKEEHGQIIFDLHLDQKQPSYGGSRMHNAEHDGVVVENEVARLKTFILGLVNKQTTVKAPRVELAKSPWYKFWK